MSVPSFELGPRNPSPASECGSPKDPSGGETQSLAVEGMVGPNSDEGTENLVLYIYYNPFTGFIQEVDNVITIAK